MSTPTFITDLIARQPIDFSLLQEFYTDDAVFAHDVERVINKYWQFAGHTARIPNPGDYFLVKLAGEEIIITRDKDNQFHALANVCRHRGSRVCLQQEGNAKAFSCPYHAWTYGADGALISAKTMPADFDKADYGLHRCHIRVTQGLIFVSLSDVPTPFDDIEADADTYFAPYELTKTQVAHREVWPVKANWKLVWENFSECYHCGPAHPEYCSVMAHALPDSIASQRTKEAYAKFEAGWREDMAAKGKLSVTKRRNAVESIHTCHRLPIKPGYMTQSRDGQPVAPLLGGLQEYDNGLTILSVYPGNYVMAAGDHVVLIRFTPQAAMLTEVEVTWLVRDDAIPGIDFDAENIAWVWKVTTDQDKQIVDDNQAGVNSRFYQPGPYADCESGVKMFIKWYLRQIA